MKPDQRVPLVTGRDMLKSRNWTEPFTSAPEQLPISFLYDSARIAGIPAAWTPARNERRIDANIVETVFTGVDPRTGLRIWVECLRYADYPVVEWTAWLANGSNAPTPMIEDLLVLDGAFDGASPVLSHSNGDFASENGYAPTDTAIAGSQPFTIAPTGGRACNEAFPYFRIEFAGCGMTIAIGWPAQWFSTFTPTADGVAIQAGQERTHLRLMPGETIRTPRMTIMSWEGDRTRAINLWRRWYLAHVLPRPNGQPLRPILVAGATDEGEEHTAATEENQIRYMDRFKERGFDLDAWWIDAGWYPCYDDDHVRHWYLTGTWMPDPERFPRGLRPVSDNAARNGTDLLLWFEPERVAPNTALHKQHPEWMLPTSGDAKAFSQWSTHLFDDHPDWLIGASGPHQGFGQWSLMLNIGIPECRQWLTDLYCKLIQDNGVKIYRQDFNFPPLLYWRDNEPADRQGINENLYVQGYLQLWDDILARNPGIWIDSCASGGRRNDLETLRRSVPLHYSDYGYGDHRLKLAFQHTLFEWIPYFKEFTMSWDISGPTRFDRQLDSFSFHCAMAAMLNLTLDIRKEDYDFAVALRMTAIWRRACNLVLHGDYYPLTPFSKSPERWEVRQFDIPETGHGMIQGIRLPACSEDRITVIPQGLIPDAIYSLENPETGQARELVGSALLSDGFTLELPRRSGAIWFYKR